MKTTTHNLVSVFSALGDKTRFKLFELLNRNEEICVSQLADIVGISTAGVSQQLKVLEQSGLIERRRIGQKICYQVQRDNPQYRQIINLIEE